MKKNELKRRLERVSEDRDRWVERYADAKRLHEVDLVRIRLLEKECLELAHWLLSEWVHVNESKVAEVDHLLEKYLGGNHAK